MYTYYGLAINMHFTVCICVCGFHHVKDLQVLRLYCHLEDVSFKHHLLRVGLEALADNFPMVLAYALCFIFLFLFQACLNLVYI